MASILYYPAEGNDINVFQGTDNKIATTIYTDETITSVLNLVGYSFTARFFRTQGGAQIGTTTALNNNAVVPGQVIISLDDLQLGEQGLSTIGAWVLEGTDTVGNVSVYDYGLFNVKDNPASS